MMGRPNRPTDSMRIELTAIDEALARAGIAPSLRHALEQLDGPIIDRRAERRLRDDRWAAVFEACREPALQRLVAKEEGRRLLRRLAAQSPDQGLRLAQRAGAVLARLPAAGLPRARLSAVVLGDAHGLDDGTPLASLVLAGWRRIRRKPGEGAEQPADSVAVDVVDVVDADEVVDADDTVVERAREVWASAGVLVNELARPVLMLNLPGAHGRGPLAEPGQPGFISLRRLLRPPLHWSVAGCDIFVCENPNVVAYAADCLGEACAPIVCTDGMPAAAQQTLLTQLAQGGARLHYHGDFDWPGMRIANMVIRTFGAQPWRMSCGDYREAVRSAAAEGHPLGSGDVEASWDQALRVAMLETGIAIAEEAVADCLVADLRGSGSAAAD